MKKYCHNCGAENEEIDKFCIKCGTRLLEAEEPVYKPAEPEKKAPPKKEKPKAKPVATPPPPPSVTPPPSTPPPTPPPDKPQSKPILPPLPHAIETKPEKTQSSSHSKLPMILAGVAIALAVVALILGFAMQPEGLKADCIETSFIKNNAVTADKIADKTITDSDITDTGISKIIIGAQSITGDLIQSKTIDLSHISDDALSQISGSINVTNESITSVKIKNQTINTWDLANNSVTTVKITDGTIISNDIATNAITSDKIIDDAITESKIANNAVDTSQLVNDAVTQSKIANDAVGSLQIIDSTVSYDDMQIKIKYNKETGVYNGSIINHDLSSDARIIVTPIFDSTNVRVIHANIISIDADDFVVGLWYQEIGTSTLNAVTPGDPIDIYWVAVD